MSVWGRFQMTINKVQELAGSAEHLARIVEESVSYVETDTNVIMGQVVSIACYIIRINFVF